MSPEPASEFFLTDLLYRYPTTDIHGPAGVPLRLKESKEWKASGDLTFLNEWEYALGAEILTPFGRSQLC